MWIVGQWRTTSVHFPKTPFHSGYRKEARLSTRTFVTLSCRGVVDVDEMAITRTSVIARVQAPLALVIPEIHTGLD